MNAFTGRPLTHAQHKLTAGQIKEGTVKGRDPQVGGTGVKQHSEVLWGSTDADHTVVRSLRGGKKKKRRMGSLSSGCMETYNNIMIHPKKVASNLSYVAVTWS